MAIMMVGLQGSGKTTTSAKIGRRLQLRDKTRVLMASLDTRRPAAQEQLRVLGEENEIETLKIVPGQSPTQIAERAMTAARLGGYDVVILDTAGRLHIDEPLMHEMAAITRVASASAFLNGSAGLSGALDILFDASINTQQVPSALVRVHPSACISRWLWLVSVRVVGHEAAVV